MSNIVINDIEMIEDLDKETAVGITGGGGIFMGIAKFAFKAGTAIAKNVVIDDGTGTSDDVSDAAIDTFGPAPKWLQSWF